MSYFCFVFFTVVLLFQKKSKKFMNSRIFLGSRDFNEFPKITVSRLALSRIRHSDIMWGVPSSLGRLLQCVSDSRFFDGHYFLCDDMAGRV